MALRVDVRRHNVLALGYLACDFDLLGEFPGSFFQRATEVNIWELTAKVDFLLEDGDGVVFDSKEKFRARPDIL